MDVLYVGASVLIFLAILGMVIACDKLRERQ
jgi:hypothetical protein